MARFHSAKLFGYNFSRADVKTPVSAISPPGTGATPGEQEEVAPMERFDRREVLASGAAASGMLLLAGGGFAFAAQAAEQLIPWADQPPPVPPPAQGW